MMIVTVLTLIIIVTIILLAMMQISANRCNCGSNCRCRGANTGMQMEITGPYEYPIQNEGVRIVAEVDARPVFVPSRTNRVGALQHAPPDVLIYSESIYSQFGEGVEDSDSRQESMGSRGLPLPPDYIEEFTERINNTRRIYLHYTNWCGFCKKMKPVWEQVKTVLVDTGIEFYEIDEDVAKTPGVNGYPTILMIDENGFRRQYPGGGNFEQLRAWCIAPVRNDFV